MCLLEFLSVFVVQGKGCGCDVFGWLFSVYFPHQDIGVGLMSNMNIYFTYTDAHVYNFLKIAIFK